jgi:hypothetical protein
VSIVENAAAPELALATLPVRVSAFCKYHGWLQAFEPPFEQQVVWPKFGVHDAAPCVQVLDGS